jgi:hypothetical protein
MDNNNSDLCRVTRLDRPSRVTVAPNGQVNVEETSAASASVPPARIASAALPPSTFVPPRTITDGTSTSAAGVELSSSSTETSQETSTSTPTRPASWTSRGGFVEASNLYWSQDRYTVVLRFQLPPPPMVSTAAAATSAGTARSRPWDCHVKGLLPYDQRHAAVQSLTTDYSASLVITDRTTDTEYFRDYVAYPVHAAQGDDVNDNETDWSIEMWPASDGIKYLTVTLQKATPVPGMTIWWRRPVRSCPEIELTADTHTSSSSSSSQQKNAFAVAWEQAHAQFRQGRSSGQERIEVDLTDNVDGDDEP